ncbi:hypothetical protein HPB51_014614 [Rhipicephalus microplus]|uniref:Uncharacterized protein n=1 Tax=Rhipicephalus microplus TaxID=6941 RepID=A0A9J6F539_RHIMP|nr:hypothetical protein HPB51_014614 [Rhipicephalus microplus]
MGCTQSAIQRRAGGRAGRGGPATPSAAGVPPSASDLSAAATNNSASNNRCHAPPSAPESQPQHRNSRPQCLEGARPLFRRATNWEVVTERNVPLFAMLDGGAPDDGRRPLVRPPASLVERHGFDSDDSRPFFKENAMDNKGAALRSADLIRPCNSIRKTCSSFGSTSHKIEPCFDELSPPPPSAAFRAEEPCSSGDSVASSAGPLCSSGYNMSVSSDEGRYNAVRSEGEKIATSSGGPETYVELGAAEYNGTLQRYEDVGARIVAGF